VGDPLVVGQASTLEAQWAVQTSPPGLKVTAPTLKGANQEREARCTANNTASHHPVTLPSASEDYCVVDPCKTLGSDFFRDIPMTVVNPFHTNSPEYPPRHREVYHDKDTCPDGKQIQAKHKESGTGGKKHCLECDKVS
jgi:hypothetical protein